MDKPSFARKSPSAKANHTDGGDFSIRPAIAPAENGDLDEIKSAVLAKLALELGKDAAAATDRDWFVAAALTIRDRVVHRWLMVDRTSYAQGRKRVYYLSLEFLIGRLFADVLCNLGCTEIFRAALGDLGVDLNRLRAVEPDAALGHGGLGRLGALSEQTRAEAISKILYPSDATPAGLELRLRQEYFFVSASLQDLVQRHLRADGNLCFLPLRSAIQLNDTHPSVAIAELMRILVDLHGLPWDEAWRITVGTFSYTNHTLLPEALESWPVDLFGRVLPRHLEIIYRINTEHLEAAKLKNPSASDSLASISLIDEHNGRKLRMGHLAFVGSHCINGVSALHTNLMRKTVFRDLHAVYPDRIVNKTNGITFRRWLLQANSDLTRILREVCGDAVLDDPTQLVRLADHAEDCGLQERVAAAKRANKVALARLIVERLDLYVDPDALFDVQIKRIHEYKRQLLNLLETVPLYHAIRAEPTRNWIPRVKIFAGKEAANYAQAKLIIKLINDVAKVINADPLVRDLLRVVFLPDYNVSLAEKIIPAADLSEQISTAGMERSGTGNNEHAINASLPLRTVHSSCIRDH